MSRALFSFARRWATFAWAGFTRLLEAIRADRALFFIFVTLLVIDLCWILWFGAAKLLYNTGITESLYNLKQLRITAEGSYPEWFNWAKTLVLVFLLGRMARSTRQWIYGALTILFAVILMDDSLAIHEKAGKYFVRTLELQPVIGLRAQDVGELITWSILGAILLPLILIGLLRSERAHVANGMALLLPFAALLFCAVFVDQLYHIMHDAFFGAGILLDMLEDGGEMIVITTACMVAAALVKDESSGHREFSQVPQLAPTGGTAVEALRKWFGWADDSRERPLGRRGLLLWCVVFAVIGAVVMMYLHAFELTSRTKYHGDLTQSPHWVAYHGDSFPEDDLLVEYAAYNETPVQNTIYWVGTWFIDIVPLEKIVGIAIYGLTAALFFLLVTLTAGPRAGVLASLFFVIFPRSSYEIAGGFSKAWAIGFVLVAVYIVERRSWGILPWVMPLAALAYPVSPVLMGAVVAVGLALELPGSAREALRGLKHLAAGSALALVVLLYKYLYPPDWIGEMISTRDMKTLWEQGISSEAPLPLWEEVLEYLEHPFFIFSTFLLLMLLHRRGIVWKRGWSALVIASAVCYFAAGLVAPRLYLPDRYTRFSVAVLLVLWFAHNWSRVLEFFRLRWMRRTAVVMVALVTAISFSDTFKPCDGDQDLGRWEDRERTAGLSRAIASLPQPVLVAGHPYTMANVVVQSRRPVLVIHRMYHYWFSEYRRVVKKRIQDTFRAIYARNVDEVNRLAGEYGVTHLVVSKTGFRYSRLRTGKMYKNEFDEFIANLARGRGKFLLRPPPEDAVLYEDERYWLVRLPLEEPDPSGNVTTNQRPGSSRKEER